jgi:hypothetical protein
VTRRALLFTPAVIPLLRGDASDDVWALFVKLAAALAEDNVPGFMDGIDPEMTGFEQLKTNVDGMIQQAELRSIIEKVSDSGDDQARSVQLNWFLQLKRRGSGDRTEERQKVIKCDVALQRKRWRVVSIDPIEFFAPPNFRS